MKTFVRVEAGVVLEVIQALYDSEGKEIPVGDRFHPEVVATLVDVTDVSPQPAQGWVMNPEGFLPPLPEPMLSDEELAAGVLARRDSLLQEAGLRVGALQDAVDLGVATEAEVSELNTWKVYRVALIRIDNPEFQPAFPRSVTWPDKPDQISAGVESP